MKSTWDRMLNCIHVTRTPAHSWNEWERMQERRLARKAYQNNNRAVLRAIIARKLERLESRFV